VGPESIIRGENGYLFVTLGDGRIARLYQPEEQPKNQHDDDDTPAEDIRWTFLTQTSRTDCSFSPSDEAETEVHCGRPLGIILAKRSTVDPNFDSNNNSHNNEEEEEENVLLVADAYKGFSMIIGIYEPNTDSVQVISLASRANQDPKDSTFRLLNSLVQAPDGSIYLSETSQQFQRRRIFYAAFDGRKSGRLLRYTKTGGIDVVQEDLYMPNGLALSHDGNYILIVAGVQILRFSLALQTLVENFASVMPGTGDNIDTMDHLPSGEKRNCYWAGLGSKFAKPFSLLKLVSERPLLKSLLVALVPYKVIVNLIPKLSALAIYDEDGEILEIYKDDTAVAPWFSEGEIHQGYLYLGSWYNPFLARTRV